MRFYKILIFVVIVGLITYAFRLGTLEALYMDAFKSLRKSLSQNASQVINIEEIKDFQISLPGPLLKIPNAFTIDKSTAPVVSIHAKGIIDATNAARASNGELAPLEVNAALTSSAQAKLDDMFAKEYFEHRSPDGVALADLVEDAGYEYIVIGENLALGDFVASDEFVREWMNSPGHRANILNSKYEEIGVAAKRGTYNGQQVWMAVQHFAKPLSACTSVDQSLKAKIAALESELEIKRDELSVKKGEVNTTPNYLPSYNDKVDEYNAAAGEFNKLLRELESSISKYNSQVKVFNACIEGR